MSSAANQELAHKTLLVIGGSSGIGEQVARQAAAAGAEVTIAGRDEQRLVRMGDQPWVAAAVALDAHDDAALEAFFAELSPVDHLVSMVGDSMAGGFLGTSPETMRHVLDSKFWANWQIGRHSATKVRDGGSLTFTSGTGGRAHQISGTYVANQAVAALVEGLAYELAPALRVNAVAPTFLGTNTRFWRHLPETEVQAQQEAFAMGVPLGRIATASEVASSYLHLMTSTYLTGQTIAVDGGVMLDK